MRSIVDLLVAQGVIDEAEGDRIKSDIRATRKDPETVLLERRIPEKSILDAKSTLLGVPLRGLGGERVSFDALKFIAEESARHYQMVPLAVEDGVLAVGMVAPENLEAREALQFISSKINMPAKIFLISRADFNTVLKEYQGIGSEVSQAMGDLESVLREDLASIPTEGKASDAVESLSEDAPITKMVAVILKHAVEGKASDVHIEPSYKQLRVRFRVDGVLYTSILLPMDVHEAILSRIKIMTNLKIDEKRKPQDGRFRARIDNRDVDFRVSTFPTYFGEKVVMRILDPNVGIKSFEDLGIVGRNLDIIKEGLKRPFGMILITGPTGSGKSTTLYAMLKVLNDEKRNIVSLEDPIEYYLEGLNQSQVRPEIDYTFASGLRSVLRQDPDVIMVGEIRDRETAQLAVHASLTGHLVLSTLHTNDAIGVIPRLIDMGIDPFLIPSTLVVAMAQRLPRTLCPESRKEIPVIGTVAEKLKTELDNMPDDVRHGLQAPPVIYEALPSGTCPKGTRGRMAVCEVLKMTPELEKIILEGPNESKIMAEARRQGMITMRQDGMMKVLTGKIGLDELFEVIV
ncbi:MAG: GspE/PulE family protein [Patescibacteria group bacterium]